MSGDPLRAAGDLLTDVWPYVLSASMFILAIASSVHAILTKREPRAVVTWVGLIWLAPGVGFGLYALFGINRIRRRAKAMGRETLRRQPFLVHVCSPDEAGVTTGVRSLSGLARLVDRATPQRLLGGNRVELLENGDAAFPAMLAAIDRAERSVSLCTYIFDHDEAGMAFADALERARTRGVDVRVLIDDVGARYSFPPIVWRLVRARIEVARFLPTTAPFRFPYFNLRNHRKTLVVDGRIGFTGGMNIRAGNVLGRNPRHPIRDLHARLEGPVVAHLQAAFAEDWDFTRKRDRLEGEAWFPGQSPAGPVLARGILDGPDRAEDAIVMALLGALAVAERRVRVVTPYFVPPEAVSTALSVAAMRGVEVDIIIPAKGNLALVHWAAMASVRDVLERGCRVWLSPAPFDHTKLMIVDDAWVLLGSANWDVRSLRLNFELVVECYDPMLAAEAEAIVGRKLAASKALTLADVYARKFPERLRNGIAHMFSPYL